MLFHPNAAATARLVFLDRLVQLRWRAKSINADSDVDEQTVPADEIISADRQRLEGRTISRCESREFPAVALRVDSGDGASQLGYSTSKNLQHGGPGQVSIYNHACKLHVHMCVCACAHTCAHPCMCVCVCA